MVEDVHSHLGSRLVGYSERWVESVVQVGGSNRYRCRVHGYLQKPEEGFCHREQDWEALADNDERRVIAGRELGREWGWREGCTWVDSAMTSLKHPGPDEGHRWVEGERAQ